MDIALTCVILSRVKGFSLINDKDAIVHDSCCLMVFFLRGFDTKMS